MNTLDEIERGIKDTSHYLSGNLANYANRAAGENPSGEQQVGADVWADDLFFDALSDIEGVGGYASEEREDVLDLGDGYAIAIDPLDGSSNLASNNSIGTIVGVYDSDLPASGRNLVASMMTLYGPYTTVTVARKDRDIVQEYLLRDGHSERWETFRLPEEATVLGMAGKIDERSDAMNEIAREFSRELKTRYSGATVADLAQVLEYGGLFGYPAKTDAPDGKLRVHFESAPLAYLVEAAGGASSDGSQSLLDVEPAEIHARTPTFLGNESLIQRLEDGLGT
jgi:fructose-1,6-bisphosphatase I